MKHWFYTYSWELPDKSQRVLVNDVFKGEFSDMVKFVIAQKEHWLIVFAREISKEEYDALYDHVG